MDVVRVKIVVSENDAEVASADLGYYSGQSYSVVLLTPDGTDWRAIRRAGETDGEGTRGRADA